MKSKKLIYLLLSGVFCVSTLAVPSFDPVEPKYFLGKAVSGTFSYRNASGVHQSSITIDKLPMKTLENGRGSVMVNVGAPLYQRDGIWVSDQKNNEARIILSSRGKGHLRITIRTLNDELIMRIELDLTRIRKDSRSDALFGVGVSDVPDGVTNSTIEIAHPNPWNIESVHRLEMAFRPSAR